MANMISILAILPMANSLWKELSWPLFKSMHKRRKSMYSVALFARLEAKPGKEKDVAKFLEAGLSMANQEATTPIWFALRLGPTTFGIFDAFTDESGRQAHLNGPIAKALMAKASELLAKPPAIEQVEVLGAKLPK
jgi:quinol monooxygenase YgiN